jgi:chemotaxis protein histidine kinase CheA
MSWWPFRKKMFRKSEIVKYKNEHNEDQYATVAYDDVNIDYYIPGETRAGYMRIFPISFNLNGQEPIKDVIDQNELRIERNKVISLGQEEQDQLRTELQDAQQAEQSRTFQRARQRQEQQAQSPQERQQTQEERQQAEEETRQAQEERRQYYYDVEYDRLMRDFDSFRRKNPNEEYMFFEDYTFSLPRGETYTEERAMQRQGESRANENFNQYVDDYNRRVRDGKKTQYPKKTRAQLEAEYMQPRPGESERKESREEKEARNYKEFFENPDYIFLGQQQEKLQEQERQRQERQRQERQRQESNGTEYSRAKSKYDYTERPDMPEWTPPRGPPPRRPEPTPRRPEAPPSGPPPRRPEPPPRRPEPPPSGPPPRRPEPPPSGPPPPGPEPPSGDVRVDNRIYACEILGIDPNTMSPPGVPLTPENLEVIKKAYRKLTMKWHPDKNVNKSVEEQENVQRMFRLINNANSYLTGKGGGSYKSLKHFSKKTYAKKYKNKMTKKIKKQNKTKGKKRRKYNNKTK